MLALRLVRTAGPAALGRRALVAAVAGAVGLLLLGALEYAAARPGDPGAALVRLLWCAAPLAAGTQLAVAAARIDPCARPRAGLDAVGVGPARLARLAAVCTALCCTAGSVLALAVFLQLRGGTADGLPLAAALTLLALPPLAATGASAVSLRRRGRTAPGTGPAAFPHRPPPLSAELPWGVAVTAVGLTVVAYAADRTGGAGGGRVPLPGSPDGPAPGVLGGWLVVALGLALAGPGLVQLCGLLLATGRPGALRLLAGRVLRAQAPQLGRPLGVLCAVTAVALAAGRLYAPGAGEPGGGPAVALGTAVVLVCAVGSALGSAAEAGAVRAPLTDGLRRLGVSAGQLRAVAALRVAALLAVLGPLVWLVAELAVLPLTR
ncbi:hypothetical protein V1L54_20875 [Streptomyces sp. TRM 70361]|uniref:hypothetical protein n=1 Tax=Streptomyces sp. TRM 70361 TaxID=3116553 RepID=UPI002E7B0101|nr:hypothetical protein [Streptomyces sp. TRM 70361]MEE1941827.1 hypothetical protein [Streptomyces sp. TRM 70361]